MTWSILEGDCYDHLLEMEENSIDSVVTDPPYGMSKQPDPFKMLKDWLEDGSHDHAAGGGFMGKKWDNFVPGPRIWKEVFRVLKPGGHALVFAAPRTVDLMGLALRLAGFEIRDCLVWLNGQGFPKNHDISKAIDKLKGAEREVVGYARHGQSSLERVRRVEMGYRKNLTDVDCANTPVTIAAPEDAQAWEGWGTALKPSQEPILLVRKPLIGTVASNVLEHGTGGLNIDATRIQSGPSDGGTSSGKNAFGQDSGWNKHENKKTEIDRTMSKGRWPANALFTHHPDCKLDGVRTVVSGVAGKKSRAWGVGEGKLNDGKWSANNSEGYGNNGKETVENWKCVEGCPVAELDSQSGILKSGDHDVNHARNVPRLGQTAYGEDPGYASGKAFSVNRKGDSGGASRFFYCAKASRKDRFFYCEQCEAVFNAKERKQHTGHKLHQHPTVKPVKVMEWLVSLITPPDGVVLDPFMGTGTTGVAALHKGFNFVGCELEEFSAKVSEHRLSSAHVAEEISEAPEKTNPEPAPNLDNLESPLSRMFTVKT